MANKWTQFFEKIAIAGILIMTGVVFSACGTEAAEGTDNKAIVEMDVDLDKEINPVTLVDVTTDSAIEKGDEETEIAHYPLVINEIIASNTKFKKHRKDYYDMVEIKNVSNKKVYLADYYLSDSKKELKKKRLPKQYLGAGKVMVIYCIGKDNKVKSANEAGFGLDSDGEKIYISDKSGVIIDKLKYEELPTNVSYGLSKNGKSYQYFKKPTFGKQNAKGYAAIAECPLVSVKDGFYKKAVKVKFTNKRKGGLEIYYTTDGSLPTTNSKKYKGETITIKSTGSIRAISKKKGCITSDDVCYCYFIGTPKYTLDTVMVSIKESDYSSLSRNVTSNTKYPAMVSLYSKGKKKWSENCGIRDHGGASRSFDKRSYKLKFSTKYGSPRLHAKLFDDVDIDSFDSILLRGGSEDNSKAMMRDELVTSLARKNGVVKGVLTQGYHPVNLYVNNQYRGVYYIREAITPEFVADHLKCKKTDVSLLQNFKSLHGKDCSQWGSVYSYAKNHDMSNKEHYNYVKKRIDLESVCDFMILQMWAYNFDENNVKVCKGADNKWRMILFDLDLCLENSGKGVRQRYLVSPVTGGNYNMLAKSLLHNKEFKKLWNKRAKKLLGKNGILSDKSAKAQVDKIYKEIKHDMKYNCDYWSKHRRLIIYKDYNQWKDQVAQLKKLMNGRAAIIYNEVKA